MELEKHTILSYFHCLTIDSEGNDVNSRLYKLSMNSSEHFLKQKIASFLGPSDFNVTYVGTALLTNTLKLMLNSLNTPNSFNLEEN